MCSLRTISLRALHLLRWLSRNHNNLQVFGPINDLISFFRLFCFLMKIFIDFFNWIDIYSKKTFICYLIRYVRIIMFSSLFTVPQVFYRSSPMCVLPQTMAPVQQMPVGQNVFLPQQQFVAPISNNNAANRK